MNDSVRRTPPVPTRVVCADQPAPRKRRGKPNHFACTLALLGILSPGAILAQSPAPLLVEALSVQITPGLQIVSLTGEIEARNTLNASFRAAGRVVSVSVEEGDSVAAGQELARIESVSQQQNLRASTAALTTAQADLSQAKTEFGRQDALLERGAATRATRDAAEDSLLSAEATFAEAQAALDLAQKSLADTQLLAPEDALVTARLIDVGQVVGAAETAIQLALGQSYDAVINVPEVLLTLPRDAPPVQLTLIDIDAPPFSGEVREVSPLVDASLGTVQVKVGLIDPPEDISINQSVLSTVKLAEPAAVALPFSALSATADGPAVWVIDPDSQTVQLRQVTIRRHQSDHVLIDQGLQQGERVVTAGGQFLYEGKTVRVAPSQTGGQAE